VERSTTAGWPIVGCDFSLARTGVLTNAFIAAP
jgi:hypothetical protein